MNIDTIITKLNEGLAIASTIKSNQTSYAAIDGESSGVLIINEIQLSIIGDEFKALRDLEATALDAQITSSLLALDTICDEIIAEIIA